MANENIFLLPEVTFEGEAMRDLYSVWDIEKGTYLGSVGFITAREDSSVGRYTWKTPFEEVGTLHDGPSTAADALVSYLENRQR